MIIRWTALARADLLAIFDYVVARNPRAALRLRLWMEAKRRYCFRISLPPLSLSIVGGRLADEAVGIRVLI